MGTVPAGVAALLAGYQPADDTEAGDLARMRALVERGEDPWSRDGALHLTASALVVHPESRRVLLRWHEKLGSWMQVGGHADPGETTPIDVALREGREETGLADLRPWPAADLRHVVVVPVPETPREQAHEHADLRFVLATAAPETARPEKPTAPLRWLSLPDALDLVVEDNLRETLSRVELLLGPE
ncbi:NUDIX domain-containing protein [Frankia sp. CNm7]|uniref:NUDIX domain-containing protein n=1 Tax=Frankia nepalensis TaxID=1836974 RepID=A0A937RN51_9ACTN|nr:NUDIX domain-containing protein [Frankia nepalensis]MBL7500789.1 NUDIX domain-containing protein [Frankia nepalensis]MBL7512596.1 NUDIX domain-containing protein [Frankia nepalensis]MBL7519517.1 NUDIX domain-containing protein [Frankia nepalensis]MBL7633522.1 NUDIX domain-containing protein [Frankia nepalensis]